MLCYSREDQVGLLELLMPIYEEAVLKLLASE